MLKLINTSKTSLNAGSVIPLEQDFNTNGNIAFSNNTITIKKSGYYKIDVNVILVASGVDTITISLYANGVQIPETARAFTFGSASDSAELVINDIEKVIPTFNNTNTEITIVCDTACSMSTAEVTVFQIR